MTPQEVVFVVSLSVSVMFGILYLSCKVVGEYQRLRAMEKAIFESNRAKFFNIIK